MTILDPRTSGWRTAEIHSAWGEYQVGSVQDLNRVGYAALWRGTADSLVALAPTGSGYTGSSATSIRAGYVVGEARKAGNSHAALWDIASGNFTDLHPTGASISEANTTDGVRQGGGAYFPSLGMGRALIWNSSPNDYIDITPAGGRGASVRAMTADTQVGQTNFGNRTYAALWHNSAESFVNLAPPEVYYSTVAATTGTIHVGWARILTVGDHACAWISDSPDGFIDLHASLGPGYSASDARAVSIDGNLVTVVGTALASSGRLEAVMWRAVIPAPGVLGLGAMAGVVAARWRRQPPTATRRPIRPSSWPAVSTRTPLP
ncbi:MAG: hypothetical protein IT432_09740 [Phycisphaerales bacterium]|nr:hypothetical protein [Phycisphaerales bacterium]